MKQIILSVSLLLSLSVSADTWTLDDCIQHALQNNIRIRKSRINEESDAVTVKQNQSILWPSISFSTGHGMTYRPLQDDIRIGTVDGEVTSSSNKIVESSNYNVSMNWTIWNGGINHKNLEASRLRSEIDELNTNNAELTIQEQIAQYYVQIMYCTEAKKVNESLVMTAQKQYDRGVEMHKQGQIAKADVISLEAQLASAKFDVVNSQSQIDNYKRQLKALLELDINTDFEVAGNLPSDERAMEPIPDAHQVYNDALLLRPEVKSAELSVQNADLQLNIAKRGYYPTIGMSAGISNSHNTASSMDVGTQLKENFNMAASVNISVPIWDQRRTRSNIEKAKLEQLNSKLDLQNVRTTLSNTIEQYWITARNNQNNFIAAQSKVKSQEASYELVNEQFQNGLKSVVDVLQSRDNILSAEQDKLQSKYITLLNTQLLKFYGGGKMDL